MKKCCEGKNANLLLTEREGKKQFVLIKGFNAFIYDHALHRGRKHFCRYCLQVFSTEEISKCHIKGCFNLNLGGLFRGLFWKRSQITVKFCKITHCLRLVRTTAETRYLVRKCAHICSFRNYTFQHQVPLSFDDVSIFAKNWHFLAKMVVLLKEIV